MKKALFLALLLTFVITGFSMGYCNDAQINATIKTFYGAIEKGDVNSLYGCLTPETVKQLKAKNFEKYRELGGVAMITELVKLKQVTVQVTKITSKTTKKDADSARVVTNFHRKAVNVGTKKESNQDASDAILFKKVNNRWLIENIEPKTVKK